MPRRAPRISPIVGLLAALMLLSACQTPPKWSAYQCSDGEVFPGASWAKADRPEDLGWMSAKLDEARAYAGRIGTTSLMVVQSGVVVDAWGSVAVKSNLHSVRKSLLSALIGIAADEGRIDLSDTMADLGIDDTPPVLTETEKQATVGDLIRSRSGIYHAALYESPRMTATKPARGSHDPGAFWYYNNWDFNTLGTIYEHAVNESLFTAFQRRIAAPLQMEDYQPKDGRYVTGAKSMHRAYPIFMTARDLARFAYLYLRQGRWGGQRIVSRDWVAESTVKHSSKGGAVGYGYMWWTLDSTPAVGSLRPLPKGYFASGWHGQLAYVFPDPDVVIVHRVNTNGDHRPPSQAELSRLLRLIFAARTAESSCSSVPGAANPA